MTNMRPPQSATKTLGRFARISLVTLACASAALGFTAACLERPVVKATPNTTNLFVDQIKQTTIDKIDLLFVIDNSVSMSDKQRMLKDAVPNLLKRLISPNCINKADPTISQPGLAACPLGFEKEFSAVSDIHIGVISSSLGGHGADVCSAKEGAGFNASKDDQAHLLGTTPRGKAIPTYQGGGFLQWDQQQKKMPPGEANPDSLIKNFQDMVVAAGEIGCGFEAQLESWYRFLVEPYPYASVAQVNSLTVQTGLDQALLDQRKAFLRADSLLAIIMLTDENDCSILDEGYGWLVGTFEAIGQNGVLSGFNMVRPTTVCETEPNSACCRTCAARESNPPANCGPLLADPACQIQPGEMNKALTEAKDPRNLRCFNQKKRFGLDLLYPTSRYARGLKDPTLTVPDPADPTRVKTVTVPNPLYSDLQGNAPFVRDPNLVFLAGIVGVPWQDIADDASLPATAGLKYLTSAEITKRKIWDDILGTPMTGLDPKDPLMIESVAPRTGVNPRTGTMLAPATSTNPKAAINGHEFNNFDIEGIQDDLQYACIFDLPEGTKDCVAGATTACDCGQAPAGPVTLARVQKAVLDNNSPLCNPPAGGAATTTQYAAKGYPGLRILEVLKDYGTNSIVASICPKVSKAATEADKANSSYGYNPAVTAIIDRLKEALGGRCLPRKLKPDAVTHEVPCKVIEARRPKTAGEVCSCGEGRIEKPIGSVEATERLRTAVRVELQKAGSCTDPADPTCANDCLCEIKQLAGQMACEVADPPPAEISGYCYIDAAQNIGSAALLKACPASEKRKLRFIGANTPASGAVTFIACAGASAEDAEVVTMAPAAP